MWRTLWEKHRGAFCFAVGMICFLVAGLTVRSLSSMREHLLVSASSSSKSLQSGEPLPRERSAGSASDGSAVEASTPEEWFLYITGSVRRPGVYRLPHGARVTHLVDAAGGLDGFADPVAVNLAQPLTDGMHVHVPRKGERPAQEGLVIVAPTVRSGSPGSRRGALVDVNRATESELTALRGIGPALARRIVEYRERNGPFRSLEELVQVRGIGPAKLEGFREQATTGP